tara:strand:+ start:306 stop:893 length:588 start_codon:yes stop_codon:yes gene_type:complete
MKPNRKTIQFMLLSLGVLLIFGTYIFYPKFNKTIDGENLVENNKETTIDSKKSNTFKNVEYKGLYNTNTPFTVKSEVAHILKSDPDLINMTLMKTIIEMNDGRIIIITSDRGKYNKSTYDSYFEGNVKLTDGKTIVLSENLDLLASEDYAYIYNDVSITNENGFLLADKIDYNFETEKYNISMFNNGKVEAKIIE